MTESELKSSPSQNLSSAFVGRISELMNYQIIGGGKIVQIKSRDLSVAMISPDLDEITMLTFTDHSGEFVLDNMEHFVNPHKEQGVWVPGALNTENLT